MIRIFNTPQHIDKELIRKAVDFGLESLMSERMIKSLDIRIVFNRKMDDFGLCDPLREDNERRCKKFRVDLGASLNTARLLGVLFHELVHVKQFATDEMYEYSDGSTRFRNERYRGTLAYYEQPWEIEAYGREIGLLRRFSEDYTDKEWYKDVW